MQVSTFPAIPVKLSLATIPSLNHITSPCKACKHVRARGFPLLRPVDLRVPDSPNICHLWSVDRFPRGLKRPLPFPSPNGHRATASMGRRGRVLISSGDCSNPEILAFQFNSVHRGWQCGRSRPRAPPNRPDGRYTFRPLLEERASE